MTHKANIACSRRLWSDLDALAADIDIETESVVERVEYRSSGHCEVCTWSESADLADAVVCTLPSVFLNAARSNLIRRIRSGKSMPLTAWAPEIGTKSCWSFPRFLGKIHAKICSETSFEEEKGKLREENIHHVLGVSKLIKRPILSLWCPEMRL